MIIAIDNISTGLSTSPASLGGMRMYLHNFIEALLKREPHNKYVLLSPDWFVSPFDKTISNLVDMRIKNMPMNRLGRVFYEQVRYRKLIESIKPDAFIGLLNTVPLGLTVPSLIFVKSLQYLTHPQGYNLWRLFYLRSILKFSAKSATRLVVPSNSVARDVISFLKIEPQKIAVIPEALYIRDPNILDSNQGNSIRAKLFEFTENKAFVLHVGATYWYKNIERLISAFALFNARLKSEHVLLLIGADAGISFRQVGAIAMKAGVHDKVICTGSLPHDLVTAAYNLAELMVMPSLYETFGHPVLEAMACGCPVVTSGRSAMLDVAGDAAAFVDPYDIESISAAMFRVTTDGDYRHHLIAKGLKRALAFSWDNVASQTLEVVEKMLAQRKRK